MWGKERIHSWIRLNTTVLKGDTYIHVNLQNGNENMMGWKIGDEIVISPTGYFGKDGERWDDPNLGSVEYRIITNITYDENNLIVLTFDKVLVQTHICNTFHKTLLCIIHCRTLSCIVKSTKCSKRI